jgi:hypothetical protein
MRTCILCLAALTSATFAAVAETPSADPRPEAEASPGTPDWLRRDNVLEGTASSAPDGVIYYVLGERVAEGKKVFHRRLPGVYRSPIREHRPERVEGTAQDFEVLHLDVSDDGNWLLYSCTGEPPENPEETPSGRGRRLVLARTDGRRRVEVPTGSGGPESLLLSGFYRQSPHGSEVFYARSNSRIVARAVDLSALPPRFGAERLICTGIAWDGDDAMAVSGSHLHGRLGELSRYVTIPEGGRGTAGPDDLWRFTGRSKFGCAVTLSHDGRLAISNPTQLEKVDGYPPPDRTFPIWHRGFVVLPFKESTAPPMDIADYYFKEAISANWVFAAMRPGNHDFSEWYATNHSEYVIGREISRPPAYGCWLVHWPTNTWTRLTPPETVVLGPAAYLKGASVASPADATGDPPTAVAPMPRLTVLATLTRASTVPTPSSIAPYKDALVLNVYHVERVLEGTLAGREVLVGHWAVRNGQSTPDAERRVGQRYRMTLEPLESHPRLKQLARCDAPEAANLSEYMDRSE